MEIIKRYGNAALALIGLAALFLPVSIGGSAVQILQRWRVQSMPLALVLCAVLIAVTVMVILSCYMECQRAMGISKVIAAVSLVVMLGLTWLDNGGFSMPGDGGLIFVLAMLLIVVNSTIGEIKEAKKAAAVYEAARRVEVYEAAGKEQASGQPSSENSTTVPEADGSRKEAQEEKGKGEAGKEEAGRKETARPEPELSPGCLQVFCGLFAGAEIEMKHMETIVIGRDAAQCNLIIEDDAVSRKHCTVTYNAVNGNYLLMDISGNGTYLADGQRIPKNFAMELKAGTGFYAGEEKNRFRLGR